MAVYASNTSSGWKSGTVLYKEKTLPTAISFFAIFRYLTYVPPSDPDTSFEICEIGVLGEFFNQHKTLEFDDI